VAWIKPYCLEFGKVILSVEKYKTFEQTVLHEIAHAIANKKYNDDCGHDSRFKEVCEEIGCYESGATTNESDIMETHEKIKSSSKSNSTKTKGYRVVCKGCGEKLSHYKTKCQTVKNIENPTNSRYTYTCPLCGSTHLGIERE
jgi:predicted SprT family Zn-dependent metalloprotease